VLSTLHTNDAPTAVPRFIDLGIPPFLVSAVLNLIMAQRLVRRICLACITSYKVTPEMAGAMENQIEGLNLNVPFEIPKTMFKGRGCSACGKSGYKGRMGIHEAMELSEEMKKFIVDPQFTLDGLRERARKSGYITMFEDGLRKVSRGMTTFEEILRVIQE
jgi:type II secretory ATPase GspE/PulE/Tfp pilus assembly ATPase PilB-like protein